MTEKYCIENDFAAQKELAEMERHNSLLIWEENKALRARVARLGEALNEISTLYWVDAPAPEEMRRIARRALEEK